MASHPFIFLLTILCLLKGLVAEAFLPLCYRTCDSSAEDDPSLHKCSCSESCAVFDDCCSDSPYNTDAARSSSFACMTVFGFGDFWAVVSCPPNYRVKSCLELLGYLPPVTSRVTNITYGNVFCASCNEDGDNLLRWNVGLRCSRDSDLTEFELDIFHIEYKLGLFWGLSAKGTVPCEFYAQYDNFEVLEDLELRPCDNPIKVSTCSETWEDLSIEQECRSYEDPVYVGSTLFRNPHCAQCNFEDPRHSQCSPSEAGAPDPIPKGRGGSYTYSEIYSDVAGNKTCGANKKFDPKTNRCRRTRKNRNSRKGSPK